MIEQLALFAQNDMYQRDLLVAAIAVCLGLNLFYAALTNNQWMFELGSVSALNDTIGRTKTRFVIAFVGTSMIAVGGHLVGNADKSFENGMRSKARTAPTATKSPQDAVARNLTRNSR